MPAALQNSTQRMLVTALARDIQMAKFRLLQAFKFGDKGRRSLLTDVSLQVPTFMQI